MEEIWKPVKGYEKQYQVSNWGRVKSYDMTVKRGRGGHFIKKGRILKNSLQNNKGYLRYRVNLSNGDTIKMFKVHRLVAEAFVANPQNKPHINHKDFNSLNNNASNLEWVTNLENLQYSIKHNRGGKMNIGQNNGMSMTNRLARLALQNIG